MALVVGVTYARFNANLIGSGNTMTVRTAELSIKYRDENSISVDGWFSGDTITKHLK